MGLLDCVSDKSGEYPVNSSGGQAPLRRGTGGMSSRRSLGSKGFFGSSVNVKSKDFEYWWHRALVYLYAPEGREDIRELKIPLRALGFNSVGDFIRDIPEKVYSHYRHLEPDTTLRKDFKVMWERDGIAEPGMLKWEGLIDGQRCLGLQLDRKKAVPFRTHDGKGLFYCKPGHRALVPASEVYPYRKFLRQFVGTPRKDSMALNLLPGRSSVRVKVAKQYKPGDRVHLPSEGKWATILWTGRISGDWVVDLVYDPEKPPEGKVASPDEPCMSRSLSMGEFIDQVGDPKSKQPTLMKIPIPSEPVSPSLKSPEPTTPPEHIPPAPPPMPASPAQISIPSPKSPDLVDEVFELTPKSSAKSKDKTVVNGEKQKKAPFHSASDDDETEEESDSEEELDSGSHNEDPGVATDSDASEKDFKRTFSEPIPGKKGEVKIAQPEAVVFETKPLKSRPTHKPLFNLASFGKKKKEKVKQIPAETLDRTLVSPKPPSPSKPPSLPSTPYKKKFHSPKKVASPPQVPTSPTASTPSPATPARESKSSKSSSTSSSFFRRDRSRSPVSKKDRWSKDQFCEVAIDVPEDLRSSLKKKPTDFVSVELHPQPKVDVKAEVGQNEKSASLPVLEFSESPKAVGVPQSRTSPSPPPPLPSVGPPVLTTKGSEGKPSESSLDESEDESVENVKADAPVVKEADSSKSVEIVELELAEEDEDRESDSSAATPPYSPAIKDVGFRSLGRRTPNRKEDRSSIKKTFGSLFSPKKPKPLPPKDYDEEPVSRKPVGVEIQRQESLRKSEDSCTSDEEMIVEKSTEPLVAVDVKGKHERRSSWGKKSGGFFSKESKVKERTVESISIQQSSSLVEKSKGVETTRRAVEDQGDQDGLVLESLEVKDDSQASPSARDDITSPIQRNGSKGKKFSFGFYKKIKSAEQTSSAPSSEAEKESEKVFKKKERSGSITPSISSADSKGIVTKHKRNSFRDSFKRTFSLTKDRRGSFDKSDKLSEQKQSNRPVSMYLDNNEVVGAKNISRSAPKSKSTSVLVDIQPWEERRGGSNNRLDVFGDSDSEDEKGNRKSTSSGKGIPVALKPKNPEPSIPKHRMFTTPKTFFGFQTKSTEEVSSKSPQAKKPFPSYSEIRLPSNSWEVTKTERTTSTTSEKVMTPVKPEYPPPPVPNSGPPTPTPRVSSPAVPAESPPPVKPRDEASSPSYVTSNQVRILKSSMKQRKEIDEIPKGLKLGDRVVWYNGRIPIPGRVQKLYKDGLDKYTAVVKFDREVGPEPLTLTREGDAYVVTVEELITPEVFGLPSSVTRSSSSSESPVSPEPPTSVLTPAPPEPPQSPEQDKVGVRFDAETKKSPEPIVPQVKVEMASPVKVKKDALRRDDSVPPPFQSEETELACGMKRGIPSRDKSCCLETILFSMFYTTNAFDDSVLFYSGFEEECLPFTREVKSLLRHEVVYPLRSLGFCEWTAVLKLKDLLENLGPDFNNINADAEIMTFVLFERALKLQKFITYSNFETDYLHQLVLDSKDLSKSTTMQRMFEKSLESMDGTKLNAVPNPALILEIPRANDKLERYEAVIPNLTLNLSHLIENGPRLCICKMVGIYECPSCFIKSGNSAMVYCENCKSMADQIHLQFDHTASLTDLPQTAITMDLAAVICVKGGHYTSFVKCGNLRSSPWLYYDAAEADTPKVSLEQNLGMWIDRLEKYPGKYTDAFAHTLLTHFLANSHICIYQPRERSSLV